MAKILGRGAPTAATFGILGQEYIDELTGNRYVCTKSTHKTGTRVGEADQQCEWTLESAGGVSSWNDLTDKPFGEVIGYGDTLTLDKSLLDGNPVTDSSGYLIKVSDAVPTIDDFVNGCVLSIPGAGSFEIPYDEILEIYNQTGSVCTDLFIVVPSDNFTYSIDDVTFTFHEKGFYFAYSPNSTSDSATFTIPGYKGFVTTTVKQIEEKYLPLFETVSGEDVSLGDTVSWDGNLVTFKGVKTEPANTGGLTLQNVKVSDSIPTAEEIGSNSTVKYMSSGSEISATATVVTNDDGALTVGDNEGIFTVLVIPTDNYTNEDGIVFPEKGVYFVHVSNSSMSLYGTSFTIPNYTFIIKQPDKKVIKPEYLPESNSGDLSIKTIAFTDLALAHAWVVDNIDSIVQARASTQYSSRPTIYDRVSVNNTNTWVTLRYLTCEHSVFSDGTVASISFECRVLNMVSDGGNVTLTGGNITMKNDGTISGQTDEEMPAETLQALGYKIEFLYYGSK